jgi:hypothetical protein
MLDSLKSMIEFASTQAEKIFRKQGVLYPLYHAVKATGETVILTPPPGDKDMSVALIKAWLALENIDRYVYIDEAWIIDDRKGNLPPLDMERIRREGVRNHPDRREVVLFAAENRRSEMLTAARFILRPEIGKPSLAPLKIDDMTGIQSEGRMVNLFEWAKK